MMGHLFIIGNGFDLHHQLPTGYSQFYQEHQNFLDKHKMYFGLTDKKNAWFNFENELGDFDQIVFLNQYFFRKYYPNGVPLSDCTLSLPQTINCGIEIYNEFSTIFKEWISTIKLDGVKRQFDLPANSSYLTFNYTRTLQNIYEIPEENVKHIHGSINEGEFIFGHCKTPKALDLDLFFPKVFFEAATKVEEAFQKPVKQLLSDNKDYFANLSNTSEVTIIGHSISEVDHPYFQRINEVAPTARWRISHYNKDEPDQFEQTLIHLGVDSERIKTYTHEQFEKLLKCDEYKPSKE